MVKRLLGFFKSRPTEFWLGLWAAVVAILTAFGITLEAAATAAVGAVVGWATTWVASKDSNTLGPQPASPPA